MNRSTLALVISVVAGAACEPPSPSSPVDPDPSPEPVAFEELATQVAGAIIGTVQAKTFHAGGAGRYREIKTGIAGSGRTDVQPMNGLSSVSGGALVVSTDATLGLYTSGGEGIGARGEGDSSQTRKSVEGPDESLTFELVPGLEGQIVEFEFAAKLYNGDAIIIAEAGVEGYTVRSDTLQFAAASERRVLLAYHDRPVDRITFRVPVGRVSFTWHRRWAAIRLGDVIAYEPPVAYPPIVFSRSFGQGARSIWAVNPDGSGETVMLDVPGVDYGTPRWESNGETLLISSDQAGSEDVYRFDPATGQITQLTFDPAKEYGGTTSPDGSMIAFTRTRNGVGKIVIMNPDGTGQREITDGSFRASNPEWAPSGEWIAFLSQPLGGGNNQVALIRPDGSELRVLNTPIIEGNNPAWLPDEESLIVSAFPFIGAQWGHLYRVRISDSAVTQLTDDTTVADGDPMTAPDGSTIVFNRSPSGTSIWSLYLLDLGTNEVTYLAGDSNDFLSWPDWRR